LRLRLTIGFAAVSAATFAALLLIGFAGARLTASAGHASGAPSGPNASEILSTSSRAIRVHDTATVCAGRRSNARLRFCRWYSDESPLNTPIPAHPAIDSKSRLMVDRVTESLGDVVIAVKRWSVPVYYAGSTTKRYNVPMIDSGLTAYGVPIPANARPSAPFPPDQTDGAMMILDPRSNCEYDFWEARKQADGSWTARGVSRIGANSDGIYDRGASARGSGFALGAGLIRPGELKAGAIRHALVFSLPPEYVKGGGPVPPATESDGNSMLTGAIPEGARIQLAPSFNVDSLEHRWERTIARALQVYGMYLADRGGGGVGLVAQNPQSYAHNPYGWGDKTYVYLPSSLVSYLRVLKLPAQSRHEIKILPSRCAVIR
jgi:hypothetical protein